MATIDITPDEFKTLESMRQRLLTLSNNINSLRNDIYTTNPLPKPSSLQASALILQQNLSSLQNLVSEHADLFSRLAVHPSTNYPGRAHENVILTLLRKKLEPDVEVWAEECRDAAVGAGVDGARFGKVKRRRVVVEEEEEEDDEEGYRPEDEDEGAVGDPLSELWTDVRDACLERVGEFVTNESRDVYTAAERERGVENVRTGLRRNLDEEEEEESEEEEDEEEEDGKMVARKEKEDEDLVMLGDGWKQPQVPAAPTPVPVQARFEPEHLLWFAVRGDVDLPRNVELQKVRREKIAARRRGMPGR